MGAAAAARRSRGVVVEVAGDEARRDAEAPQRLHHQDREVATGPRAERERLGRGLRAFLAPRPIAEFGLDRVGHRLQHCERAGVANIGDETARPRVNRPVGIPQLPLRQPGNVGQLFQVVTEREGLGALLQDLDRRGRPVGVMGQVEG